MLLGERIRILARFLFSSFNVVSCPPAQRAHAQAGARGGYYLYLALWASFDPTYLWKKGDRREASGADVPAP